MFGTMGRRWVLAAAVGLVVGGAVAYGAIPGDGASISACYQTIDGQLRVIDAQAGESCRQKERSLTWSQAGAPGAEGPEGPRGETGSSGPAGPAGVSGYEMPSWHVIYPAGGDHIAYSGVACPAGTKVVSGGGYAYWHDLNSHDAVLLASAPFDDGSGWFLRFGMPGGGTFPGNVDIYIYGICATVS